MKLRDAIKIYAGASEVVKICLGSEEAWSGDIISPYQSQYPPAQNDTYVKASLWVDGTVLPYFATDPALSVIGSWTGNGWLCYCGSAESQRFHIDLGEAKIITRIYYENSHYLGTYTGTGVKNFTFWGSDNAGAFLELTYAIHTNWTQLITAQSTFDRHIVSDIAAPKYILVTNTSAYRYYAIKMADIWDAGDVGYYMGFRRVELQG